MTAARCGDGHGSGGAGLEVRPRALKPDHQGLPLPPNPQLQS